MSFLNPYAIKRSIATVLCCFVPTIAYMVTFMITRNAWMPLIGWLGGSIIMYLVTPVLLAHPFRTVVEGDGMLVCSMDSTGVIRTFTTKILRPFIRGQYAGMIIDDSFDRNSLWHLQPPVQLKEQASIDEKGGIKIQIDEKEFNKSRFVLGNYVTLLWNDNLKTMITKDFFAEQEKNMFAEHIILNTNRKLESLSASVRDFGRTFADLFKPKGKGLSIMAVLFAICIIVLAVMFLPKLIAWVKMTTSGGAATVQGAVQQGSAVIPLPTPIPAQIPAAPS